MATSIVVVGLALRAGLRLRRARRGGGRLTPDMLRRHTRLAKAAVTLVAIGFTLGPSSMWWLRAREPLDTAHALFGTTAVALFATAAVLGRRLERGRSRAFDAHALAGVLAFLAAAVAAIAGFDLLP